MSIKRHTTRSKKNPKTALVITVCLVGCVFSFLFILQTLSRNEPRPPATSVAMPHIQEPIKQPRAADYGLPVRLKIPKVNVDAAIEYMGLTSEGDMQEPTKRQNTGWYKFGPHPGNKGSAVVAGHYSLDSKDAPVFNKLHTLSKGDLVHVEDEKGRIATFIVRELKTYDRNAAAPEVFNSSDEKAHLNLVTCKGAWQKAQQTYSDRLVVFADSK